MKHFFRVLLPMLLAISIVFSSAAIVVAEEDPFGKYEEPIKLTTVRTADSTIEFDESNPEKKSFDENRWINAFKEELNIELSHMWIAADDDANTAKWSAAIASGNVPDFAYVNDNVYQMLCEAGLCADMTEILPAYGSEALLAGLTEDAYLQMTYNGKLSGMPLANKALHGGTILFVRQDWLEKVNMEVPKTIEDVVAVARAFKEAKLGGEDTIGILFGDGESSDGQWDGFMNGFGAYLDYWVNKDGKLVWSNTTEEMRSALLAMQELYSEGTMNQDVAVANSDVCAEYIASGKAGIFYCTSWNTTMALMALHNNDPESEIVNLLPVCLEGEEFPRQTNSPKCRRIFISAKCKNPEAVVKMANLSIKLVDESGTDYGTGSDGFMWFKYLPWGDMILETTYDLDCANAIRLAEATGDLSELKDNYMKTCYESYQKAKVGESDYWWLTTFGPDATYTILYDAWHNGQVLTDGFSGLPTATMQVLGDIVNDELRVAMIEVIMGADISRFDSAVTNWYANGGQAITDEVNAWLESVQG